MNNGTSKDEEAIRNELRRGRLTLESGKAMAGPSHLALVKEERENSIAAGWDQLRWQPQRGV